MYDITYTGTTRTLFNEDDTYTEEALTIEHELAKALQEILYRRANDGVNVRDLAAIGHNIVQQLECEMILDQRDAKCKAKQAARPTATTNAITHPCRVCGIAVDVSKIDPVDVEKHGPCIRCNDCNRKLMRHES